MSVLQSQLKDQQKIIEFLTSKYEKDTGRRINLPSTLGTLLGDDSIGGDESKMENEEEVKQKAHLEIVNFKILNMFSGSPKQLKN
jgi:hypothetical protein